MGFDERIHSVRSSATRAFPCGVVRRATALANAESRRARVKAGCGRLIHASA